MHIKSILIPINKKEKLKIDLNCLVDETIQNLDRQIYNLKDHIINSQLTTITTTEAYISRVIRFNTASIYNRYYIECANMILYTNNLHKNIRLLFTVHNSCTISGNVIGIIKDYKTEKDIFKLKFDINKQFKRILIILDTNEIVKLQDLIYMIKMSYEPLLMGNGLKKYGLHINDRVYMGITFTSNKLHEISLYPQLYPHMEVL